MQPRNLTLVAELRRDPVGSARDCAICYQNHCGLASYSRGLFHPEDVRHNVSPGGQLARYPLLIMMHDNSRWTGKEQWSIKPGTQQVMTAEAAMSEVPPYCSSHCPAPGSHFGSKHVQRSRANGAATTAPQVSMCCSRVWNANMGSSTMSIDEALERYETLAANAALEGN